MVIPGGRIQPGRAGEGTLACETLESPGWAGATRQSAGAGLVLGWSVTVQFLRYAVEDSIHTVGS